MTTHGPAPALRVVAETAPGERVDPFLVPAAVRALLRGGEWPAGPERQVAEAVARAVEAEAQDGGSRWR